MPAIEVENLPPSKKKKTVNRISRHDWNIKVRKIETLNLEWGGVAWNSSSNDMERVGTEWCGKGRNGPFQWYAWDEGEESG